MNRPAGKIPVGARDFRTRSGPGFPGGGFLMSRTGTKNASFASPHSVWTPARRSAALALLILALAFPLNSYGVVNTLDCSGETNTLENYNVLLAIQQRTPTTNYNLGFTAICLGRYDEGLDHMRRASEGRHVAATKVLGSYYDKNRSFDNSRSANLENTYRAITYYERASDQIESISSYPEGSTRDMGYIEYVSMTSYRVFTRLPGLHFNIYSKVLGDIVNRIFHSNTLEILQKMGDAATRCLRRPALAVWKEKKERVYRTQQIECRAYLDFVEATYPLEDERIQIADNCKVSIKQCKRHKEKIKEIIEAAQTLFRELKKSPGLVTTKR